jgi:hypothetical protein
MSITEHDLTVTGTLDALRESVDSLRRVVQRRASSRSGEPKNVDARADRKVDLLASNPFRHMATIYNDSTAICYVALDSNAGPDHWTIKIFQDDYWETPAGYTGPVSAIWEAATGRARVTELS